MIRNFVVLAVCCSLRMVAQSSDPAVDQLVDKIAAREQNFLETIQKRTPLIETYIQESASGGASQDRPVKDHYFLGRFSLTAPLRYYAIAARTNPPLPEVLTKKKKKKDEGIRPFAFPPRAFVQMTVIDLRDFNRQTYKFEYVRREFLGEVRCLVFDVTPANRQEPGRFIGRIWVEDRDYAIVRFNGTYVNAPVPKSGVFDRYFHFDSWRVNLRGAEWVPAEIYVEEEGFTAQNPAYSVPKFKAQSRVWDYEPPPPNKLDELTSVVIDNKSNIKDDQGAPDRSPLESERLWEHQAEENVLARLEKAGFIAPKGPVDDVLNTVVNNLIISANLNIEAHCRVLLTTPLESFPVGQTIVISRGLLDVLPDEASLALVLADQLAHMALGYRPPTQFAFRDNTMLDDATLLARLHFRRTPEQISSGAKKALEIIRTSPYKNSSKSILFLDAVAVRGASLQRLLEPNLGDQIPTAGALAAELKALGSAPATAEKPDDIVALPLGSRVKLNPANNQIELIKARPISLLSERDKIPFEITPFMLNLTRSEPPNKEVKSGSGNPGPLQNSASPSTVAP